ncbi:MAG: hypothetical protein NPIRA02_40250 [Nitrospirales bacterium]|nr:MAG: hypothetical protein NPIRA02_40250 [Nitrospirales bacterium]
MESQPLFCANCAQELPYRYVGDDGVLLYCPHSQVMITYRTGQDRVRVFEEIDDMQFLGLVDAAKTMLKQARAKLN